MHVYMCIYSSEYSYADLSILRNSFEASLIEVDLFLTLKHLNNVILEFFVFMYYGSINTAISNDLLIAQQAFHPSWHQCVIHSF